MCFSRFSEVPRKFIHEYKCLSLIILNNEYFCTAYGQGNANQGGLHSRTKQPKKVIYYANTTNPDRCFIHIYKTYMSKCPSDGPAGAFYLQPLQKPKGDLWFSKVPCGHNTLQKIVPELMKAARISGYFTNHSLCASAAT